MESQQIFRTSQEMIAGKLSISILSSTSSGFIVTSVFFIFGVSMILPMIQMCEATGLTGIGLTGIGTITLGFTNSTGSCLGGGNGCIYPVEVRWRFNRAGGMLVLPWPLRVRQGRLRRWSSAMEDRCRGGSISSGLGAIGRNLAIISLVLAISPGSCLCCILSKRFLRETDCKLKPKGIRRGGCEGRRCWHLCCCLCTCCAFHCMVWHVWPIVLRMRVLDRVVPPNLRLHAG
ncbi:hypothetical protein DsansV1_C24g0182341 [Dioscorea sansibarensis]